MISVPGPGTMRRHPNQIDILSPDVLDFPENLPPNLPIRLGRVTHNLGALLEGRQQILVIGDNGGLGAHQGERHQEREVFRKT